jgi:acyl transferase domain-containing protein
LSKFSDFSFTFLNDELTWLLSFYSFIEAHGTGTTLGDSMEIQGISDVFANSHTQERPLVIGAAKSCIGHTEMAAGLVGLVKGIMTTNYGIVPGLVHLTASNLNKDIDTSLVPLVIPHQATKLSEQETYRGLVL